MNKETSSFLVNDYEITLAHNGIPLTVHDLCGIPDSDLAFPQDSEESLSILPAFNYIIRFLRHYTCQRGYSILDKFSLTMKARAGGLQVPTFFLGELDEKTYLLSEMPGAVSVLLGEEGWNAIRNAGSVTRGLGALKIAKGGAPMERQEVVDYVVRLLTFSHTFEEACEYTQTHLPKLVDPVGGSQYVIRTLPWEAGFRSF